MMAGSQEELHKVLLVEDNRGDQVLVREMLQGQPRFPCEIDLARTVMEALELSGKNRYDVLLLDLNLPDSLGLDTFRSIQKANPQSPVIVLSGVDDQEMALEAAERGVQEYLVKGEFESQLLVRTLLYAIQRKQTEEELRKLSHAIQQSPATVIITDTEGRIEYVNSKFSESSGYAPNEVLGKSPRILKSGEQSSQFYKELWETILAGKEWRGEFCNQKKDGETYWESAWISPIRDAEGSITHFVAVKEDITERKRVQAELKAAHEENKAILESISAILIGVDENGVVTQWNGVTEETFGITASQAKGRPITESGISWDWTQFKKWMDSHREIDGPVRLEEMVYGAPDGRDRIVGFTMNPLRRSRGQTREFLFLGADVTEQKHLQAQLAHAQKLEAIGQLAAGIAHEINTPTQYVGDNTRFMKDSFGDLLKVIIAFKDLAVTANAGEPLFEKLEQAREVEEEIDLDYLLEEIPRAIEQSLEGLERIAKIVRAMKEFSHPGTEEKTPVDLNKALENTLTVARNEWKYVAEVETNFDSDLPLVPCLPDEMNQVILNIVVNAAHTIKEKLGSDGQEKGTILISTRRVDNRAEIRIKDTGGGIPEEIRNRIFEPFFTTKEVGKGTGQGLAIAHSVVVDKHDGSIDIETELGQGTTFIIRLPLEEAIVSEVVS